MGCRDGRADGIVFAVLFLRLMPKNRQVVNFLELPPKAQEANQSQLEAVGNCPASETLQRKRANGFKYPLNGM